jgi:M6 family metalloprotease-like protein/uncharacterized repeat protein (TIGR02543 family)
MITKGKEGLKVNKFWISLFFLSLFLSATSAALEAAYLRNVPVKIVQPNGEEIQVFASGDEFYNWLHDKDGFTIIRNPRTGYYVYALEKDGDLLPSNYAITSDYVVNATSISYLNIPLYLKHSWEKRKKPKELFPDGSPANIDKIRKAPQTGAINNIVIFIRFSDEIEFTDYVSIYDDMFNDTTAGANSMYNYFKEVSYDQLEVATTFYPTTTDTVVSYQDSQPRAYYQKYDETTNTIGYQDDDESTEREHTLLKNAVDYVSPQIPGSLDVDGDNDGRVDNVCFIIYGGPDGWSDLLWPHMWSLYTVEAYINDKIVRTYNFQLQTNLSSSGVGVGVLCHEMFHSLGAPDLYHYSYDGLQPVYKWDIMEWNLNPPQHMGVYMKYRYGTWISSIPEITSDGTYDLNPLTSPTNNCYRIASPYSSGEYFMVEYRKKDGTFESSLPGEGLLVYRINKSKDGKGNQDGPPDEVYIYRPDGTTTVNGNPSKANFSIDVDRPAINDAANPSSFLSDGCQGGLDISNIGSVNGVISFDVTIIPGLELAEALDNYDLSWQSGGDEAGWLGQSCIYFYDNDAAKSGYISDNQSSYLETTVQGPVNLAYYWKVSSEEDYDFLTFYVDDEQIYQISGEADWEQKFYAVSEGSHSIKWEYKKDLVVSKGSDCGWVDKVEYISGVLPTISGSVKTSEGGGIEEVMIFFSNAGGTVTTDSDGSYSHTVSPGWSGTATPSKAGYVFSPPSRDYSNVTSDQTDQDYKGTPTDITYTISGNVSMAEASSPLRMSTQEWLGGVVMNGLPGSPITDASGNYSATVEYGWSGTVIPSKAGYSFSPSSRTYSNVTSDQPGQDYTATTVQPEYLWNSGGPHGGYIMKIAISQSNPEIIYSGTKSGIYKTTDNGESWTKTGLSGSLEVNDVAVDPSNPNIVYAGAGEISGDIGADEGFYKSTDGGNTWTQKYNAKVTALAVDPSNLNILFFCTLSGEIYKSTNGGESWVLKHTETYHGRGVGINSIVVDPEDSSYIYVGTGIPDYPYDGESGFLKSADGGETWEGKHIGALFPSDQGYSVVVTPSGYSPQTLYIIANGDFYIGFVSYHWKDIYKSTDKGETWTELYMYRFDPSYPYYYVDEPLTLAIDPLNPDWLYFGSTDRDHPFRLYKSSEGLWYYWWWDGVGSPLPSSIPSSIAVNPEDNATLFLGFSDCPIYKSTDSGNSWNLSNKEINNADIHDIAVSPADSDTAFAAVDGFHLHKTSDGGASWTELNGSSGASANIQAVAINPNSSSTVLIGSKYGFLYRSTDGGASWSNVGYRTFVAREIKDIWIDPSNSNIVLVAVEESASDDGGVFRNTDGGITTNWDLAYKFPRPTCLASDPKNHLNIYLGTRDRGYIVKSSTMGVTWENISPYSGWADKVYDIVVDSDSKVFTATDNGLWIYDGAIWTQLLGFTSDNIIMALAIDRSTNPETVYMGTKGEGVFFSQDAGNTWIKFNGGLGNLNITKLAIGDTQPKVIYAGTAYGGVWNRVIRQHALTIAAGDGGTTDPAPGSYYYNRNAEFSVTAAPDPGYEFEAWTGDVSPGHESDNPLTITMDSNKSIAANFSIIIPQVTISGSIKTSGDEAVESVTVAFSNGGGSTTTDSSGNYSHSVNQGWSGNATPSKTGYAFSPESRSYDNVASDQTGQDYTATILTYTISGKVSTGEALANKNDLKRPQGEAESELLPSVQPDKIRMISSSGMKITQGELSGVVMNGLPENPITDASGNYSATVEYGWSATVTPSKAGYTFSPASIDYTDVTSDQVDQDYTATLLTYTVSGNVSTSDVSVEIQAAAGLSGVVMDGLPGDATTDTSGNYSATVDYGWSGTVTPTKTGYSFSPPSRDYADVTSDQLNHNYTASIVQHTLIIVCGEGGKTTPSPGTYIYDYGTEVSITATPESGCRCAGWTGDVPAGCENDNPVTITMDSDKTITADFIRQYTLTIAAGAGGTTDPAPGNYTHDSGTQVQVTARPDSGYQFSGWTGDATGATTSITITMDSDKSITATFEPKPKGDDDGGGCFIATSAYGSPIHPHLDILRDFRDKYLMPNGFGRKFVELYYRYSPGIADFISKHRLLKVAVRINLLPAIAFSYSIVHLGAAVTGFMLVFILVSPILFIRFYQGKGKVL